MGAPSPVAKCVVWLPASHGSERNGCRMDLLTVNDLQGEYPSSYYAMTTEHLERFNAARGSFTCDVYVVGAGFMGLSTAYHFALRGYDVVLLDAQRIGFGASGRNGGQVSAGQRLGKTRWKTCLR